MMLNRALRAQTAVSALDLRIASLGGAPMGGFLNGGVNFVFFQKNVLAPKSPPRVLLG